MILLSALPPRPPPPRALLFSFSKLITLWVKFSLSEANPLLRLGKTNVKGELGRVVSCESYPARLLLTSAVFPLHSGRFFNIIIQKA